ncbi:MAG: hypothetical protein M3512_12415 [Bacteroidota bacterium]|nr:hypothetical protein [Bacteroidota bacterium]
MDLKKIFGSLLTLSGIFLLLLSGYAFLKGGEHMFGTEITTFGAIVPFIVGAIFLGSGIRLLD